MYKSVRKKVAESLNKVDPPEHYDWNKWLREPFIRDYYVESVYSGLIDTHDIQMGIAAASLKGYTFDLPRIKISKAFKQLNIHKQKTNKIFFSFPQTISNSVKEILSNAHIGYSLSVLESEKGILFRINDGKNKQISEMISEVILRKFYIALPAISQIPLLLPGRKIFSKDFSLNKKAEVYDLLSNLKTEVIKVELLDSGTLVDPIKFSESREIEFQPLPEQSIVKEIEVIKLEKLLSSISEQKKLIKKIKFQPLLTSQAPDISEFILPAFVKNMLKIMSVKNIKINATRVKQAVKIDDKKATDIINFSFSNKHGELISDQPEDIITRDLEVILQPVINFGKEEKDKIYNFLYEYQKPAADYLSENKFVLLNDELGTGKTAEVIGALKLLFRKKDISGAIIVTGKNETGWEKRDPLLNDNYLSGWFEHFRRFSPGISTVIIKESSEVEWKKSSAIKITSYEIFKEAVEKNLVSFNELNRRGCVVIDEIEDFPDVEFGAMPKYLWMLSGVLLEYLENKISTITGSDEPPVCFGRTREDIGDLLQNEIKQDYWLEMDPEQRLEYNKALESGRERIYDLVQAGNPFLVQSNVFTLIHQLTQIGNFYGNKDNSPKSELLLHHIKTIQKSGKKVLVFTQYDRQGTQRLEKLFSANGIKYVLYQTGISLKEMEEAVKRFSKNKSITVFLAGMKALNAKINLANVPYLIHFDQWWSPVSTWQAEERVNPASNNDKKEKLIVYNYLIRNSIEDKIKIKLIDKGLFNKNLFDLLNSELIYSLISNEDWLEVLDLVEPKDEASLKAIEETNLNYVLNLSTDDFAHKIKALISRIGYKKISLKTSVNPDEVRLYGIAAKNTSEVKAAVQCLNMKQVTKKIIKEFIDSLVTGTDKIFIFTTGEIDKKIRNYIDDSRVVFIDKYQVSKYLSLFSLI